MMHPLEGVTRFVSATVASAGAGNTDVDLRPDSGKAWELLMCYAYQDDGAVSQRFLWTDPDAADQLISAGTAAGANATFALGQISSTASYPNALMLGPLVLTYDRYITYRFVASAGAKNGNIFALVREFRGVAREA